MCGSVVLEIGDIFFVTICKHYSGTSRTIQRYNYCAYGFIVKFAVIKYYQLSNVEVLNHSTKQWKSTFWSWTTVKGQPSRFSRGKFPIVMNRLLCDNSGLLRENWVLFVGL